jgi:hypothetical protein
MLEAQLAQSGLSDAEKAAIRAQAQTEGMSAGLNLTAATVAAHQQAKREADIAWLEQAEETEQDRHAKHINSDEYKAYQAGLLAWHQEQEKKKQAEEEERKRQAEYAANQAYAALREKGQPITVAAPKEKPWWEQAWDAATTTAQNATTTVSSTIAGIFPQPINETYKLASPTQHSTGETPGLWDYIKGDIFQGLSDIKQTISNTAAGIVQNINGVGNEAGDSVSGVWSGKLTMDQAWNNVVVAAQNAYSNSNSLVAQGKKEIVETYTQTTDVVLHKTADWLDSKRNPVYDLFAYGLEGISQQKLVDTREVIFSSFPVNVTKDWLGMPDFMELSASVAGGAIVGLVQGVDMVVLPGKDKRPEYGQPDLNSFAFFHSPGVQVDLPGAGAVACSGYGYINKADNTIADYRGSVVNLGLGGFFPVIPVGGNIEAYHSLSPDVSQEMLSDIGKQISLNPGGEVSWEIMEKLADARILPSHYGPLSSSDEAVLGYRVCVGAGTTGWDAHVSITDADYINLFGNPMKFDNVPTPIINAIIDFMEIKPENWQW